MWRDGLEICFLLDCWLARVNHQPSIYARFRLPAKVLRDDLTILIIKTTVPPTRREYHVNITCWVWK